MQPRRRYSLNRQPQFRRSLRNHPIPMLGGVAMLISLAIIDSASFVSFPLSGGFVFQLSSSRSAAQRTLDASARMARRNGGAFVFLLRSAPTFAAEASRARGLRTSADILTEHRPDIFTEQ